MGYTALYRKFRPQTFSEIVGQDHITKTLKNQIISGRVGHAYLFSGSRGTGKTSAAKILARAVNCLNPQDGEPCNKCEICKAALSGSLTDIVEMDAASNNGVEDIRVIREEVNFLPTKAKYRVYIIDEVHMLSQGAFNALLKTLEEPPEHVKFILATTEPQKLLATILSRCQRFDFKKISNDNVEKRLEIVCKESNIKYTKDVLLLISELSEGAMRDALSILERCVQDGNNEINSDKIKELIGIPQMKYIYSLTKGLIDSNVDIALQTIGEIIAEGKDINNFIWEVIKYVKDILIYKVSSNIEIYSEEEKKQIDELAKTTEKSRLVTLIYQLSELEANIKKSSQKLIMFEAGIIKLCANVEVNQPQILQQKNIPRTKLETNIINTQVQKNNTPKVQTINTSNNIEQQAQKKTVNTSNAYNFWPNVINNLKTKGKMVLSSNLKGSTAKEINDMTVGIYFSKQLNSFERNVLEKQENKKAISDLVSIELGKVMNIKYISNCEVQEAKPVKMDIKEIAEGNDIPFNIID